MLDGDRHSLSFYYGFAGIFTSTSTRCDSGTVFLTHDKDNPVHILYFASKASDPERALGKDLPIKKLAEQVVMGQTNVQKVFEIIGPADQRGKRIDTRTGITHNIAFYDASHWQNDSAISEKWMLVGYDDLGVVQDLLWVSSLPHDIKQLGSIEPAQFKQISRMSIAGFFTVVDVEALSMGTRIDPVQVDALIKTGPRHINDIKSIIGKPSAMGIKTFKGDAPVLLSNWSYAKFEIKGMEHGYVPVSSTEKEKVQLESAEQYLVVDITQSRLIVGHDQDGVVREIMWMKPFRP